ncbi:hypothetical protein Pcinc_043000 [Petrolisthes cinctipes]|uniref:Uncharacterized protein n=1 Tax=Petrolisthes cinctipes TaxID=88211 RepID=A0AAE1EFH3_PETCI|nr:hypothetical protein Pcinc_043000 [Petrolisthes cinctipes]
MRRDKLTPVDKKVCEDYEFRGKYLLMCLKKYKQWLRPYEINELDPEQQNILFDFIVKPTLVQVSCWPKEGVDTGPLLNNVVKINFPTSYRPYWFLLALEKTTNLTPDTMLSDLIWLWLSTSLNQINKEGSTLNLLYVVPSYLSSLEMYLTKLTHIPPAAECLSALLTRPLRLLPLPQLHTTPTNTLPSLRPPWLEEMCQDPVRVEEEELEVEVEVL